MVIEEGEQMVVKEGQQMVSKEEGLLKKDYYVI